MKKAFFAAALIAVCLCLAVSCGSTGSVAGTSVAEDSPVSPDFRGKWYTGVPGKVIYVEIVDMLSDNFSAAMLEALDKADLDAVPAIRNDDGNLMSGDGAGTVLVGRTMDLSLREGGVALTVEFMLRNITDGEPAAWFRISHSGPDMDTVLSGISEAVAAEIATHTAGEAVNP